MSTEQLTDPAGNGWRHALERASRAASMLSAPQLVTGLALCDSAAVRRPHLHTRLVMFSPQTLGGEQSIFKLQSFPWQSGHSTADARDAGCWGSVVDGELLLPERCATSLQRFSAFPHSRQLIYSAGHDTLCVIRVALAEFKSVVARSLA